MESDEWIGKFLNVYKPTPLGGANVVADTQQEYQNNRELLRTWLGAPASHLGGVE